MLIDQAIHSIDLVRFISGENMENINAIMGNISENEIEVEDSFLINATLSGGGKFLLMATSASWDNLPLEIGFYGKKGEIIIKGDTCEFIKGGEIVEKCLNNKSQALKKGSRESYWGIKHFELIEEFYNSILGIGKMPIDFDSAVETQRIINKCYSVSKK